MAFDQAYFYFHINVWIDLLSDVPYNNALIMGSWKFDLDVRKILFRITTDDSPPPVMRVIVPSFWLGETFDLLVARVSSDGSGSPYFQKASRL